MPTPAPALRSRSGRRPSPLPRVLLIVQCSAARETIAEYLEVLGHRVLAVGALSQVPGTAKADVVVADMPALRALAASAAELPPSARALPIVAMEEPAGPAARGALRRAGVRRFVPCPVALPELSRAIRTARGR